MNILADILEISLFFITSYFALYAFLEWRHARIPAQKKSNREQKNPPAPYSMDMPVQSFPTVSIFLPIRNEKYVIERLIRSVCAIQYPLEKLDIWVLDDSIDSTKRLAKKLVKEYAAKGIPIQYASRKQKKGFKAGNLTFGLGLAQGEYITIFDADFIPPEDFLLQIMPYFKDETLGLVQTRLDYMNKNTSFLTKFQSLRSGHKEDMIMGLLETGNISSLTGSSWVWRRECIDDIGGVRDVNVNEDMDMSFRAILGKWKSAFASHVVTLAELPESMTGFRLQRERWAHGHFQTCVHHAKTVLANNINFKEKINALVLMFSSTLVASFYLILIFALPAALLTPHLGVFFYTCCLLLAASMIVWAWSCVAGKNILAHKTTKQVWWKKILNTYGYIAFHLLFSLYFFHAGIRVLLKKQRYFDRTPKGEGQLKYRQPRLNERLFYLELFSFIYSLLTLAVALYMHNYWVVLLSVLMSSGFGMGLYYSWQTKIPAAKNNIQHVFITGATGAIGKALALQYASNGIHLTLHGRNLERLQDVKSACEAKGSTVETMALDLNDLPALQSFATSLCAQNVPDLVIANAGRVLVVDKGTGMEDYNKAKELMELNFMSIQALVHAFVPHMQHGPKRRQIALVSSILSYVSSPISPTYCASKAAVRVYGDSLRTTLQSKGIDVSVIIPGAVASPLLDDLSGPKPLVWTAEKAAKYICHGLEKHRAHISFPRVLHLGLKLLALLPACLAIPITRWFYVR